MNFKLVINHLFAKHYTDSRLHVSRGNRKTGAIPAVSFTPGRTCSAAACKTCLIEGCYALRMYKFRETIRNAWDENTDFVLQDPQSFYNALYGNLARRKNPVPFFRWCVGGDIFTTALWEIVLQIARDFPETKFLLFTKQFDLIPAGRIPSNLVIIPSAWHGVEVPENLKRRFAIAYCLEHDEKAPAKTAVCPGSCITCNYCFNLSKKAGNVAFYKH